LIIFFKILYTYSQSTYPAFNQNLVENGSFEDGPIGGGNDLPTLAPPWQNVNGSGGDRNIVCDERETDNFLSSCFDQNYYDIPCNRYGYIYSYSDIRYVGLELNNWGQYRGGAAIKLIEPLKACFKYRIKVAAVRSNESANNPPKLVVKLGNSTNWDVAPYDIISTKPFGDWSTFSKDIDGIDAEYLLIRIGCYDCVPIVTPTYRYMYIDNIEIENLGLKECCLYDLNAELTNSSITNDQTFVVEHDIIFGQNCIVEDNAHVYAQAGNQIRFKHGTHLEAGSYVHAYLDNCTYKNSNQDINTVYKFADKEVDDYLEQGLKIDSLMDLQLSIYPNPNNGKFKAIITGHFNENISLSITNMLGEKIYSKTNIISTEIPINISDQPKGIYFIKIITGDKEFKEKIIVN
ncbi:MAG: T9SS type A sorting domain-containing protein, partial [Bacteroidota bacterium]